MHRLIYIYLVKDFTIKRQDDAPKAPSKVVSIDSKADTNASNPTRLESRRKTAANDADLLYLKELYLDPWKKGNFKTYEVMISDDLT